MFYQDNNDYMRDSYFYGNGMNYGMNPYMQNNFQSPMQTNQNPMNLENMYPQIYRIISPVVNRVIANTNYPYITEDTLNNMTDTVYNIVEGDVSSLMGTQNQSMQGDDTVQQVNANAVQNNRGQNNTNPSNDRRGNNSNNNNSASNGLLRDLIKIILIKELLSRRNYMQNQGGLPMSYYNPFGYGMY